MRCETLAGIDYLFDSIPKYLSPGFTVQIGKMGYFRVAFRSEGSETPEEVMAEMIKRKRLVFVCGKEIRDAANGFSVEKFPEA